MLNRQFGLEFEHISELNVYDMAHVLTENKVVVDHYATGHARCPEGCYSGWQCKTDGSISPQDKFPNGVELVSPPLTFKQSAQIRKVLKIAREHGGINSSCGLHVHIHAPELTNFMSSVSRESRELLERNWLAVEDLLFTYMPLSRRSSDYCRGGFNYTERYQAMNLTNLSTTRRTIEFRMHSATLNPDKALSWVALCMGFVDAVVQRQTLTKLDTKLVVPVQPKLVKTRKGGEFWLHRTADQWLIESPKLNLSVPTLKKAFQEHRDSLALTAKSYLPAFHYPHFGNAMTELCRLLRVNGIFRGYLEDRYDHMLSKYGPAIYNGSLRNVVEDEGDYYNEPDYDEREAA